ncbi:Dcm Site-specific DNA methylase [uncultured Caudovirales phage]|uniref:DNA (cytosine-5-)-methyltransferase n=1 Tax=uncultured Caudovirales phage TaxID=2100421 RepID=A0A6J7WD73_9CAUD|nr:Dcm Site-specific DNA methylase [uncultured Caudovirales phage]
MKEQLNELALFAGAGGGILGGHLLGWRTVCAVEWEPYPASVLCARQNDGFLPPFPIWDDVQTFDGKPWRGIVDVVSGGFPCQDISAAGKGAGIDGERSGMWKHMARVVGEVRPKFVFVENSPMLVTRGLERVLGDLTALGYDAKWTVMGAADVGANHQRDRIWIVGKLAHAGCELRETWNTAKLDTKTQIRPASAIHNQSGGSGQANLADTSQLFSNGGNNNARISVEQEAQSQFGNNCGQSNVSNADLSQRKEGGLSVRVNQKHAYACDSRWWQTEPDVGRMANGLASGVDRLKAIGNGQVPLCAATAWRLLSDL